MAISGLSLGLMVGWWLGSWFTLGIVILAGITWHAFVRPIEERDLEQRFGATTSYTKHADSKLDSNYEACSGVTITQPLKYEHVLNASI